MKQINCCHFDEPIGEEKSYTSNEYKLKDFSLCVRNDIYV